ncbi:SLC13 family permease [Teredinibacter sp. KSP-S5-2]|uniref:SLC13 family permease n=1 Tax=Teredinibacter sp. KSP-S5-2 TaxID=3034506 RepID=UPI002934E61A|nr:SLC13 family permease [Teredinibacter sp. KSP-S5-2]WNO07720.1 SLC13 family permease [Teredinibacter sp. KSP-S5-2]
MNSRLQAVSLYAGPVLGLFFYYLCLPWGHEVGIAAGVACLCVAWWLFEPVPIPVTSLVPLAVFQLTGVLTKDQVGQAYGNPLVLLMLGGFILSKAMEKSGAHRRLAFFMIHAFGGQSSRRLVFGFMVASAFLSMWISNTATSLMLLPVALAILDHNDDKALAVPLMLGIAYAASIGGIGTPIGTPPNLIFMQVYEQQFGVAITFSQWMSLAVPVVIIMLPAAGFWLTRSLKTHGGYRVPEVGHWTAEEKRVLTVFAVTALLWITRKEPFGGWSALLDLRSASDGSVALLAVVAMFVIPSGKERNEKLLNWQVASTIPWGVLLLFGGGICLAKAFSASGLSEQIANQLSHLAVFPIWLIIFGICLGVTFLTEVTSNTASTVLLMPVLASTAMGINIDGMLLMVPAAMSASCAFMMPVATPPNSIVYGSGYVTTRQMARAGLVLNLIGAFVIGSLCMLRLG